LIVGATGGSNRLVIIVIGLSALAVFKHKSNIQRLLAGTEHRFGAKQPAGSDATRP
jgi:glycerol-3-phosphate acyltransferase PlsY